MVQGTESAQTIYCIMGIFCGCLFSVVFCEYYKSAEIKIANILKLCTLVIMQWLLYLPVATVTVVNMLLNSLYSVITHD